MYSTAYNLWTFTWFVHFELPFRMKGTDKSHTEGFLNSTLIYFLFSLIISEFLVDIKHNQNRWYWFKVKALALIYFCNCMKKIVENLKTGLRFLSCNFFLAIFKWNYLSQEWICKVCKTKFLIRRVLEPILDLFPISNTRKFERNFLRLTVSFV